MKFLEPQGLLLLLGVVLIIFGPTQLPKLAKTFGKSAKLLRDGLDGKLEDEGDSKPTEAIADIKSAKRKE